MRGFLQSIKDGVISTFDAFDEKLNRLIRVQQQDTTQARMGMEASLMKLYNALFETSEYLQNGFDNVTDAIYEASSIMPAKQAEEMEFVAQKWLGSLYSVGMSSGAVSSIAQAIGQVASGDIQGLSSGMQNLIAMALTKTSMSYDQLLTGGVSAVQLNELMNAIVSYLQDIANNSDNNVVQKTLSGVFGVTLSDIKAATNLTQQDIATLTKYSQSYEGAVGELRNQLSGYAGRMSESVFLSNVFDNFLYSAGMTIAGNPVTYFMQKLLTYLPNMEIPMPQAMGFGLSSGLPLNDLIQTALTGFGILGGIGSAISSLGNRGGMNLEGWGASQTVTRGSANINMASGISQQKSASQVAGSSGDIKSSAMGSGVEQGEEAKELTSAGTVDDDYNASNIYKLLTGKTEDKIIPVSVYDTELRKQTKTAVDVYLPLVLSKLDEIKENCNLGSLFGATSSSSSKQSPLGSLMNSEVTISDMDPELIERIAQYLYSIFTEDEGTLKVKIANTQMEPGLDISRGNGGRYTF